MDEMERKRNVATWNGWHVPELAKGVVSPAITPFAWAKGRATQRQIPEGLNARFNSLEFQGL